MEHLLARLRPAPTTARKLGRTSHLYYIRIIGSRTYYKIGYTAGGEAQRIRQLSAGLDLEIEVIDSLEFKLEQDAYRAEQTLHLFFRQTYPRQRYDRKKQGQLLTSGDSEVYIVNLMEMPQLMVKVDRYNDNYWSMLRKIEAKKDKYRRRYYRGW